MAVVICATLVVAVVALVIDSLFWKGVEFTYLEPGEDLASYEEDGGAK